MNHQKLSDMKQIGFKIVMGYIRHGLTTAGGAMVAKGVMTQDQATTIIGAVIVALNVAWSHYSKIK